MSLSLALVAYATKLAVAAAEPLPIASVNLALHANPECATRADLITRVRARSPRVRFVDDDSGLAIQVQISLTPAGAAAGDITLSSPGAKPSLRHVPARSCAEAADAVALIIAVTLDPESADARRSTGAARFDVAPAGGARSAPKGGVLAGTASTSAHGPAAPGATADPPVACENCIAPPAGRATFGVHLAAESVLGVAPGLMPGVALFATAGLERRNVWSPVVMLGVRHAWRTHIRERGGSASFTLDAATLDACPLRFRFGAIEARPCGSALFGRLAARGTQTFNPAQESARPFWVVGGAGVVTADLGKLVEVSARLAVGANLVRDSFEFSPALFHAVPLITAQASVGIGVRWR